MLKAVEYNRSEALKYAKEWALKRNPKYINFENLGGDCTSFVSQCLYAGCGVMNFTPIYGWCYKNGYDKSPSWSGVEFLYNFIVNNKNAGPFGVETNLAYIKPGDIMQLGNIHGQFHHTLLINLVQSDNIFVSAHSEDSYMRPLNTYHFDKIKFIHIVGARMPEG